VDFLKESELHFIFSRGLSTCIIGASLAWMSATSAFADGRNTLESTWYYDGGTPIADMSLPTITLQKGQISGTDSCNNIKGTYQLKGKSGIHFMAASTMMMCADMTFANAFQNGLRAASSYRVKNGKLILRGKSGKTVLVLNRINK
jgi:heat shock protein HslJ